MESFLEKNASGITKLVEMVKLEELSEIKTDLKLKRILWNNDFVKNIMSQGLANDVTPQEMKLLLLKHFWRKDKDFMLVIQSISKRYDTA